MLDISREQLRELTKQPEVIAFIFHCEVHTTRTFGKSIY